MTKTAESVIFYTSPFYSYFSLLTVKISSFVSDKCYTQQKLAKNSAFEMLLIRFSSSKLMIFTITAVADLSADDGVRAVVCVPAVVWRSFTTPLSPLLTVLRRS